MIISPFLIVRKRRIAEKSGGFYNKAMRVIADLHIHSRFSRATSKKLTPAYLDRWARIKGIDLLGTGDCTHPLWLAELREQLEEREPGLYVLQERARAEFDGGPALNDGLPTPRLSGSPGDFPRFALTGEISTIYKKGDATRKIHHLVILPDFKAAASFQTRLEREGGNIRSDGRPILGIDSRDLLSMLLDTDERSLLIPAHIWTPWFSALGAQSGFDSIDECYGDLASRIPAVETGLSSNPPMNWALAALDRFAIVSNSDAHSPEKLGREATVFDMSLDYPSLYEALWSVNAPAAANGNRIAETIEFFPQEGKYHYDGHRKCGVYLNPQEAAAAGGVCPVCGEKLTRGVMGRVLELACRPVDETAPCPPETVGAANLRPYRSLIPLPELLGELLETGAASKRVGAAYDALIEKAGSEFAILLDMEAGEIARLGCPGLSGELLASAVTRMRSGDVSVTPGYDGEYGVIRAFPPGEKAILAGEPGLFDGQNGWPGFGQPGPQPPKTKGAAPKEKPLKKETPVKRNRTAGREPEGQAGVESTARPGAGSSFVPDRDQEEAVSYGGRYALIIAGPGTGKTATLAARITRLIREGRDPSSILALSFTVKAAGELRERIVRMVSDEAAAGITAGDTAGITAGVTAATFHSFCCALLREQPPGMGVPENFTVLSESGRDEILEEILKAAPGKTGMRPQGLGKYIEGRKRFLLLPGETAPRLGGHEGGTGETPAPFLASLPELAETFGLGKAGPKAEALYGLYRRRLREEALLDFDDLVAGAARLLAGNPVLLAKCRARYRCILVDEYQDVNFAQYVLVRLLAPNAEEAGEGALNETEAEIRVIGDPNQAIYGFRGADKRFLDRFGEDYPGAARFSLSRSFRCGGPIINAAGRLTDTRLAGTEQGVSLFRAEYPTEKSEAEGIARRIARLIGGTSFFAMDSRVAGHDADAAEEGLAKGLTSLGECAVLLRTAALAGPVAKALKDHGLPFEVTGERPWWEEEPVKTVLDRLRESVARFSGQTPAEAVRMAWQEAEQDGVLKGAAKGRGKRKAAGEDAGYAERLRTLAGMYGSIGEFLDTLAVSGSGDAGPGGPVKREAVRVMTIHASKGLEFDHVFTAGLEEGILPFTLYDGGTPERIAEEKRLLYVAMTRARRGLYLSWARTRMLGGRKLEGGPSRFLTKLEELVPLAGLEAGPGAGKEKQKSGDIQGRLF
ncbi:MAG: UvrD-helicase domain-containing protein [Treponema sp.]|nr:UvrD-helicase domain-containing protein [Treponema sp.]